MNKVQCAPIIIPTLCRYEHFKRCISSLEKNELAKHTDIYIGLDYPAKDNHWAGYNKIKDYIYNNLKGFANVVIVEQEENKGAEENIRLIKKIVLEKYDRYIFTEDDNEFAPNFLPYMNYYLDKYKDDDSIQAVTGYAYPIMHPSKDSIYFQNVYFAAYGYGTWKNKEQQMFKELTGSKMTKLLLDDSFMKKLKQRSANQYCNFVKGMLGYGTDIFRDEEIRKIDITFGIWMLYRDKYMIFPTVSMVRNWGFDGSGENCRMMDNNVKKGNHRSYDFSKQYIDDRRDTVYLQQLSKEQHEQLNNELQDFFNIMPKEYIRTMIARQVIKIFGLKKVRLCIAMLQNK